MSHPGQSALGQNLLL